jgi:hypothetical protein
MRVQPADCFYGDNNAFEEALLARRMPHVLARRALLGRGWAPADTAHSSKEAALPLQAWHQVERRYRDGHIEQWWATELTLLVMARASRCAQFAPRPTGANCRLCPPGT